MIQVLFEIPFAHDGLHAVVVRGTPTIREEGTHELQVDIEAGAEGLPLG